MANTPKFDRDSRTFETRVKFIDEIFSETYSRDQIMASCIQHKLNKSFEAYIKDIHKINDILASLNIKHEEDEE